MITSILGAGGTQRLTRFVSLPTALDLMLTGKSVRADKAKKLGIVDLLVDPLGPGVDEPDANTRRYLEEVAVNVAKQLATGKLKVERKKNLQDKILAFALKYDWIKDKIFGKAKSQVMKMSQGLYPAPLRVCFLIISTISHYLFVFIDLTSC